MKAEDVIRRVHWDAELYEAKHSFVWELGSDVIGLLRPLAGERILDLGCGTGQLTQKIGESGAIVLGVDASADMIGQARQNFPKLKFVLRDGECLTFDSEFNAVFSNAALHWMLDARSVVQGIERALKRGGRLVAEFGGQGNIRVIEDVLRSLLAQTIDQPPRSPWYFPSVSQYTGLLESEGLEVQFAHLFDRPTLLEGENGMQDWLQQFGAPYLGVVPQSSRITIVHQAVERLRPFVYRDGHWFADYRRLRITAVKL